MLMLVPRLKTNAREVRELTLEHWRKWWMVAHRLETDAHWYLHERVANSTAPQLANKGRLLISSYPLQSYS